MEGKNYKWSIFRPGYNFRGFKNDIKYQSNFNACCFDEKQKKKTPQNIDNLKKKLDFMKDQMISSLFIFVDLLSPLKVFSGANFSLCSHVCYYFAESAVVRSWHEDPLITYLRLDFQGFCSHLLKNEQQEWRLQALLQINCRSKVKHNWFNRMLEKPWHGKNGYLGNLVQWWVAKSTCMAGIRAVSIQTKVLVWIWHDHSGTSQEPSRIHFSIHSLGAGL